MSSEVRVPSIGGSVMGVGHFLMYTPVTPSPKPKTLDPALLV